MMPMRARRKTCQVEKVENIYRSATEKKLQHGETN
jgi:hypothetical protein